MDQISTGDYNPSKMASHEDVGEFKIAVDHASDQILITDTDGIVIYANAAVERVTGFAPNEVVGKKAASLWKLPMSKGFYQLLWKTIKDERKIFISRLKNKRKDGAVYTADIRIAPVVDSSGQLRNFIGIERDVSKEVQLDQMKDEFIAVASHELRTPLTAIDGIISMIVEGEYGEVNNNLKQPLADVNAASARLIALVNDLLRISRIQAGRIKYTLTEFDIKPVIEESEKLLAVMAKEKGLTLKADSVQSVIVQADSDKVKEILNNLVDNSIKFTDTGGITITTKSDNNSLIVYVQDTGIGIPDEDKSKIFEKFMQLDSGKGRPAGTGLGLYITKEYCIKMGGDLFLVASNPHKGSVFAFSLPLAGSDTALRTKNKINEETKEHPDQKSDTINKI